MRKQAKTLRNSYLIFRSMCASSGASESIDRTKLERFEMKPNILFPILVLIMSLCDGFLTSNKSSADEIVNTTKSIMQKSLEASSIQSRMNSTLQSWTPSPSLSISQLRNGTSGQGRIKKKVDRQRKPPPIRRRLFLRRIIPFPDDKFEGLLFITSRYRYLCDTRYRGPRICGCDESCMRTRSCCIDYLWDTKKDRSLQSYLKRFVSTAKKYKDMSCENVLPPKMMKDSDEGLRLDYLVVSTCNMSHTNASKCHHSFQGLDSLVVGNDSYLYRNKYCAQCNGVGWKPLVEGNNESLFEAHCRKAPYTWLLNTTRKDVTSNFSDCVFYLTWKAVPRLILQNCINNSCSMESPYYDLCHSYSAPFHGYQNYHCFICNRGRLALKSYEAHHFTQPVDISLIYPWSCSLKFSNNKGLEIANIRVHFPILEFLGINYIGNTEGITYLWNFLSSNKRKGKCSCNSDCMETRTCCIDTFWDPKNPPSSLQSYITKFLAKAKESKHLVCATLVPGIQSGRRLMVTKCRKNSLGRNTERCLNLKTKRSLDAVEPVLGSDHYLYRNKYCAFCNSVHNFSHVVQLSGCNISNRGSHFSVPLDTIMEKDIPSSCPFSAVENNILVKACPKYVPDKRGCNVHNRNYALCSNYVGKVGGFSSYHCMRCQRGDNRSATTLIQELHKSVYRHPISMASIPIMEADRRPLGAWSSYLWRSADLFGPLSQPAKLSFSYHTEESPPLRHIPILSPPRHMPRLAPPHQMPKPSPLHQKLKLSPLFGNGTYTPLRRFNLTTKIVENQKFDNCLFARRVSIIAFNFTDEKIDGLMKALHKMKINNSMVYKDKDHKILALDSQGNISRSDFAVSLSSLLSILSKNSSRQMLLVPFTADPIQVLHYMDMSRWYPGGRLCADPIDISGGYSFSSQCNILYNNTETNITDTTAWIKYQNGSVVRKFFACAKFYLHTHCTLKVLSPSEYFVDKELNLVHYKDNQSQFRIQEYIPTTSGYAVCATQLSRFPNWLRNLLYAEGYVSVTGTCISVCCYICIICIYLWYKVLRNMGGLIGLVMCCCLLIADSLYLLGTYIGADSIPYPILCPVIGVFLHYALLSAHVWSLILAFDITYTLTAGLPQQRDLRLYQYCGMAFGIPFILISSSTALNYTHVFVLGYGKNNMCFITNLMGRLAFYTIPVAMIIVSNISMVSFTLVQISRQRKANEKVLGQSSRNAVDIRSIAIRLIVTIGLTEVFGFVILPPGIKSQGLVVLQSVCNFLYSFLRSIRGLLLLFAYVLRGNVANLVRDSVKRSRSRLSTRWSTSSMRSDIDY